MIETILGLMEESELEKKEGVLDNETEYTTWTEYYAGNELVHRSAHVTLKQGFVGSAITGKVG